MNEEHLKTLIDKFLSGTASAEELLDLNELEKQFAGLQENYTVPAKPALDLKVKIFNHIEQAVGKKNRTTVKLFKWLGSVAAMLLIGVLCVSLYRQEGKVRYIFSLNKVISTGAGEIRTVTLADGSEVTLNSGSMLSFPTQFTGLNREVSLEGEAFFSVAHNKHKPFLVKAGKLVTKVLGTSFDIAAYPELKNVKVTVSTGRVMVSRNTKQLAVLVPDKQIVYNKQSEQSEVKTVENADYSGWRTGTLIFKQALFEEVALTLEKAYGLKFHINDNLLRKYSITSKFEKDMSLKAILDILSAASCSHYTLTEHDVYFKGKPCSQSATGDQSQKTKQDKHDVAL